MSLSEINELNEVISEKEFHDLTSELIATQRELSERELLNILDILAEKFGKFYNYKELNDLEVANLSIILVRLTDFNSIERMRDLYGLLFGFGIKYYYEYLKRNIDNIKSNEIKIELIKTIKEYENNLNIN